MSTPSIKEKSENSHPSCNVASSDEAARFEDAAIAVLRATRLRITMPRVQVIRALSESQAALSPHTIHERIHSAGGKIDVVSVYRILAMLEEVGLIHHVGIVDGYIACRGYAHSNHAVQHMVCKACGCVEEIVVSSSSSSAILREARSSGFQAEEVRIELLGECAHCRSRRRS